MDVTYGIVNFEMRTDVSKRISSNFTKYYILPILHYTETTLTRKANILKNNQSGIIKMSFMMMSGNQNIPANLHETFECPH